MIISGRAYHGGGHWSEQTIIIERGEATWRAGRVAGADIEGLIVPPFLDGHSHIGDRALRGRISTDFWAIHRHPDGLKHAYLRGAAQEEHIDQIRAVLVEMVSNGIAGTLDFREGGEEGIRRARVAAGNQPFQLRLLGRDIPDADHLLAIAEGVGFPSLTQAPDAYELAMDIHRLDLLVAIHASEVSREPIEQILELDPDLLIHLCMASDADLDAIATDGVTCCVCPTSNQWFSLPSALPRLLDREVPTVLGTDNAFLGPPDLLAEFTLARELAPGTPEEVWLKVLFDWPRNLFHLPPGLPTTPGPHEAFLVLPEPLDAWVPGSIRATGP